MNDQEKQFDGIEVDFEIEINEHISFDFDDICGVEDGQFKGDIVQAVSALHDLKQKVKELEKAIDYVKAKREKIITDKRKEVKP